MGSSGLRFEIVDQEAGGPQVLEDRRVRLRGLALTHPRQDLEAGAPLPE
jgi:hypothetical protein